VKLGARGELWKYGSGSWGLRGRFKTIERRGGGLLGCDLWVDRVVI